MPHSLAQLFTALPAPTLRRLASYYDLTLAATTPKPQLLRALLDEDLLDPTEFVPLLDRQDLALALKALGLDVRGKKAQLAARLTAALTTRYLSFARASARVRKLGLASKRAWDQLARADELPAALPPNPHVVYSDQGWTTWADWLGLDADEDPAAGPYLPFESARAFAQKLRLSSWPEWLTYAAGQHRQGPLPGNVPPDPQVVYAHSGWRDQRDWLGLPARVPFAEAREFARSLGLRNHRGWVAYCRGERPDLPVRLDGIPAGCDHAYRDEGWSGWGDFLGTGNRGRQDYAWRPFEEAREFVRSLGLASQPEFQAWCRGERPDLPPRPDDVPTNPHRNDRKEWQGYGDWLGTGAVAKQLRTYRPIEEVQVLVQELGIRSQTEWYVWTHGQRPDLPPKPDDVPHHPQRTYRKQWKGWGAFLGTGAVHPKDREYLPFRLARTFVRSLGLKNTAEWLSYLRGERPDLPPPPPGLPTNPQRTYRGKGWKGAGDWLGTGYVATLERTYRPFEEARSFVRQLGLRSSSQYRAWARGALEGLPRRPADPPSNPWRTYAEHWQGWEDFLGRPPAKNHGRDWRPFVEAREFVRSLGLRNEREWRAWLRGERPDLPERPRGVPANPGAIYVGEWAGLGDWLGSGTLHWSQVEYLSFEEARAFARKLELRPATCSEWRAWCAGQRPGRPQRPANVPTDPRKRYAAEWQGWEDWLG
ncbi:MAG: hypothetical protein AB7N76_28970 [Planctomycetota bacterium]